MTGKQVIETIQAVRCPPFSIFVQPVSHPREDMEDLYKIHVIWTVKDIDTGLPLKVGQHRFVQPGDISGRRELLMILSALFLDLYAHEIDEQFIYKGKRVRTPHRGEK